ncbi:MAG: phosphonate ABC transporter ATP-binding protein [Chloroflexi bacterium]|nr:phosphonate ABC transporter ATP-binding protein [Chloroflexota bacterium]
MLQIEHLTKIYDPYVLAVDDISFTVPEGQFLVLIGLSGSGKSTLLRCINRLVEPTSGRVIWKGVDITALPEGELRRMRRRVAMIFQQFNLVKRSSVLTNVLAGRLGYINPAWSLVNHFPRTEVGRAMQMLDRVGIADKAQVRADELSGGQQQRVGIARALMQQPEVILADEPVSSLDPATSHSILHHLEVLNKEEGITILCSLHFLSLARRYADRIIALKAGKMVFEGPPAEIDEKRFKEIYGEEAEVVEIK